MSLLQEIRKQPEHARHIMMWLCVVITFSLVGFVWFKSTQEKFVAMLNPQATPEAPDQNQFAYSGDLRQLPALASNSKPNESQSPLASIASAFSFLRANLTELIGSNKTDLNRASGASVSGQRSQTNTGGKVLPLSGNK